MIPPPVNPSTRLARELVEEIVAAGITDVVLAPGSRNAPLAFAVWQADRDGRLRLHTRIDERSAGFLAVGLGKVGHPTAVVCTSGTAVANLHPAVLEAAHAGVPLVLITADRPASLRGTGAAQTTGQVGIFAEAALCFDIAAGTDRDDLREALSSADRPVHVNAQFAPPLVPDGPWESRFQPALPRRRMSWPTAEPEEIDTALRTVVVAGDDAGPAVRGLAEKAGWPLLAEPTSGSRTGDNAIRSYRPLLATQLGEQVQRVVVGGHPTLSRPVMALMARDDVEVVSLPAQGIWTERPFSVARHAEALTPVGVADPAWLASWKEADRKLSLRIAKLLADEEELTPYQVAATVNDAVPPGGLLFVGASSPIRDLELVARPHPVGERRMYLANRGLAGIDGTVSSAIGAAIGRDSTRSFALMGDVTFLHDSGGLVLGPDEVRPDLTIVVVNDDGGSIFAVLEQGDEGFADSFDRVFGTPHGVDIGSLCAATRTPHWRVESRAELEQALASPNGGIEVVEVRVRRDNRRDLDARIRALAHGDAVES
ncbi:2-succinyl-5-enolpyruvyl-6-hydroxy-3-cyclohexene-1-carboxylic-acid synthase [Nocardioides alcanivorans]|uniref:2-succinyl-5-enolpyruvyl-6-hydroxy-3- cyclohexene-1-carboxylic-acid synthase n=1 Tax=Nocardioides alcanivorans TaxID=2897352 RepID=UPI001F226CE6|nr:2-succinyl-5-enolpyruvyl-6-hydroxy-3-cyclohexene-1-carboxylic-acid synthase [Nocardioides alcanivorans]